MLDTDQLRSFLAIVDSGSFTKAAERVHKTQSAVSMHIRRLEEQLGCALFVKQGRGARLTDEGERLIEFARRIIQVEAGAMAALSRKGLRGAVRLGIPDDYAEVVPGRHPRALQSPSSAGRGVGRLRGVDRTGGAGGRGRARSGADHRLSKGSRDSSCCARSRSSGSPPSDSGWRRDAPIPLALGSPTCCWRRATEEALAATPRRDARRGSSRRTSARSAPSCASGLAATILPASTGRSGPPGARARRGLAGTAPDPHGPHPCARTSERGSQGACRGDPRDHRRRRRAQAA